MPTLVLPYCPTAAQAPFHRSKARVRIVIAGRRFGKSKMGATESLAVCLEKPAALGWAVSPSYAQSELLREEMTMMLRAAGVPHDWHATDRRLTLVGGSRIYMKSADQPDNLRGAGLDWLFLDEAARISEEAWIALRPSITDKPGRLALVSSPRGKDKVLFPAYSRALDGMEGHEAWRWPSSANPFLAPAELAAAKRELPSHVYRQEYDAEILSDAAAVFQSWQLCKVVGPMEGPKPGAVYSIGLDTAKYRDFSAICVLDMVTGRLAHMARWQQMPWPVTRQKIAAVCQQYPGDLWMDATGGGDILVDELRRDGLNPRPYVFTGKSKPALIEALIVALDKKELVIPEQGTDILQAELAGFEWSYSPSGHMSYEAASGLHDDCVCSLALANWGRRKLPRLVREVDFQADDTEAGAFLQREGLPGGKPRSYLRLA